LQRLLAGCLIASVLPLCAHETHSIRRMTAAAKNFLASLDPAQKEKAMFAFGDEERQFFHFIPSEDVQKRYNRPRKGLPLREMTVAQRHLAGALMSAGLSQQGYIKATTIMSLEEVLKMIENDSGERRNPEKYFFSIFGEPSETGTWGYRIEGHHVSMHFSIVNGKVVGNPMFLGANPAEVRVGPRKGLRALAPEEDLGRDLIQALTPEQRKVAIVSEKAYPDILTEASRKASLQGQPSGLQASKMTAAQRKLLDALLAEYTENLPEELAAQRRARIKQAGNNLFFAWAGVLERGGPHYYRIQAPSFIIEYDNTQNNANHIHSVWRDINGDWGVDLLEEHYKTADHHKKQ